MINKNLFTLREGTLIRSNGVVTTFNKSEYKISGVTTNATNLFGGNVLIGIFPAGTYKYSSSLKSGNFEKVEGGSFAIYLRNSNSSGTSNGIITQYGNTFDHQKTFTLTEETPLYLQLYTNVENTGCVFNDCIIKTQIEREDFFTDYIEHKENYIDINLQGNFIGKIGDVTDTLRVENGRAILTKRIGKYIPNINTRIAAIATPIQEKSKFYEVYNPELFSGLGNQIISLKSNIFTGETANNVWMTEINNHCSINVHDSLHIRVDSNLDTTDKVKQFLVDKNAYFIGILKEPYEVDLGEVDMPKTFKNINNVQAIANINPSDINLTYALDLKKYYDNKIAELSNQLL